MDAICRFGVEATLVANEFIDRYMADANGEYVKVYLYLLRHHQEKPDVGQIADALNHTEADVRRALSYWEKLGALTLSSSERSAMENQGAIWRDSDSRKSSIQPAASGQAGGRAESDQSGAASEKTRGILPAGSGGSGQAGAEAAAASGRPVYSQDQVNRLQGDGEFSQLLYIAQRYLNKIFTQRELEVFAYLYEGLSMSSELLEYLVEYCVQNGHISVRYMETVAMSWHEKGIRTALEAKDYSASYSRDSFAVMKAFGINSRKPAAPEQKLMDKWFRDYGFSREVVLEACNRTITAIHNPSFQYADKILSDWQKAGIRGLTDIKDLDAKRTAAREESGEAREKRLQKYDSGVSSARQGSGTRKNSSNQFHNFKQRDTDYDALVLKQVKEWVGQQP